MKSLDAVEVRKSRLYFPDGRIEHYHDNKLAYAVWLALPKGARAAFRAGNDTRPVYPWDHADAIAAEGV